MSAVATPALCWRIERADGVAIGLTAHDRDLWIDGLRHAAAPGAVPAAIRWSGEAAFDQSEVQGALASDAVTAADLIAGRWDGARAMLFRTDWTAPDAGEPLFEGEIGAVEMTGKGFAAELRGPRVALARGGSEATSPGCRARLGDRRCRVAMAGRRQHAVVLAVDADMVRIDRAEPWPDGWAHGRLRWWTGANSGLRSEVVRSEGDRLWLRIPPPGAVAVGERVEVEEGCDGVLATCVGRFGNAVNFRGEPHLPGIDLLTQYPGG